MTDIHISFGPVQSFISNARKTQDLWSGSYLLSSLSRAAVHSVLKKYPATKVIRPYLKKGGDFEYLKKSYKAKGKERKIGTFPNLLELQAKGNEEEIANTALAGWDSLWDEIAKIARSRLESAQRTSGDFDIIWTRQVKSAWNSYWAIGEYRNLPRRKAIRTFNKEAEDGPKCTMCGDREVLRESNWSFSEVRSYWESLGKTSLPIHNDGSERLCSICFIKRVSNDILPGLVNAMKGSFPSTTSFALLPWRMNIAASDNKNVKKELNAYLELLKKYGAPQLSGLWGDRAYSPILDYDGDYFLSSKLYEESLEHTNAEHEKLLSGLKSLRSAAKSAGIQDYSPYYAILAMDGDSMGETLSGNPDQKETISEKMSDFAASVAAIVNTGWGRVIYSGGDDVLALVPQNRALCTALNLRKRFLETMDAANINPVPTISAGILFAHLSAPLKVVITRAHSLLESFAKEHQAPENAVLDGRPIKKDAFAIETWNRGGTNLRMVKKWESLGIKEKRAWIDTLNNLVLHSLGDSTPRLPSRFLYSISALLKRTNWKEDDADELEKLFLADYMQSRDPGIAKTKENEEDESKAIDMIRKLIDLALHREEDEVAFSIDHILLIDFLSRGGPQQ